MKYLFTLLLCLASHFCISQQMTIQSWDKLAETDKRLLPKYGYLEKDTTEQKSDREFIELIRTKYPSDTAASKDLIKHGFKCLHNKDLISAMYRFNQAYLLDSTNSDIYWGYADIYMTLGASERAKEQYLIGLQHNPKNPHLLTDYGTYFMSQYFALKESDKKGAKENLELAIRNLNASYKIDPTDENTSYKLSVCYWIEGDCKKALKFYDECIINGGHPITEEYTRELMKSCNDKK